MPSLMSEIQVGTCLLAPLEEMLLAEAGWRWAMQVIKDVFIFLQIFDYQLFCETGSCSTLLSLCDLWGNNVPS